MAQELIHFDRAKRELALATNIDEVKEIRNKAEALRQYAKQAGESLTMQNQCAEIKIRAERRAGELIPEQITIGTKSHDTTLSDLNITKDQSVKYQDIATIPEEKFEEHIAKTKDQGEELTSIGTQRLAKKLKQIEQTEIESPPLPEKKYQTLVIDPPWPTQKILREVRPKQDIFDYPTMTIEQIKQFPLNEIAAENCHLYLWTTHKFLPDALDILNVWGFKYQCLLTWVKNVGMTPFSWMYSTEHCLFGRQGNLGLLIKGVRLDFHAKVREHSRKPDEFYNKVILVSPEPRIDIFSREEREGFEQYGIEKEKFSD